MDIGLDIAYYYVILYTSNKYYYIGKGLRLDNITEMLKGVLEGCVLEVIGRRPTYGYDITQQLRKLGFEDVVEGTVYTILVRLERNSLVSISKQPSAVGPPRKFYSLTPSGHQELKVFWDKWDFVSTKLHELRRNT